VGPQGVRPIGAGGVSEPQLVRSRLVSGAVPARVAKNSAVPTLAAKSRAAASDQQGQVHLGQGQRVPLLWKTGRPLESGFLSPVVQRNGPEKAPVFNCFPNRALSAGPGMGRMPRRRRFSSSGKACQCGIKGPLILGKTIVNRPRTGNRANLFRLMALALQRNRPRAAPRNVPAHFAGDLGVTGTGFRSAGGADRSQIMRKGGRRVPASLRRSSKGMR